MPFNTYRPDLMGEARLDKTGPLICGEWTTITLTYKAGHFGIDDLGGIKISLRSASDETPVQFDDPEAPGFTKVSASNGARLRCTYRKNSNIRPWGNTLHIQCLNFLSEGDTITVTIGDKSHGSPGVRMQTFRESTHYWRVHVDAFATYDFTVLPEDRQPKVELVPGPAAMWKAILPTLRGVGEKFALGLKAEDRWGNPTGEDRRRYVLRPSRPVIGLPETISMAESNEGAMRVEGLSLETPGDLTVEIIAEDGSVAARSNILRTVEAPRLRHYWSDMHGQSGETVGTGTARQYFAFGRDKAFIDICGHQGNDFQITDEFWDELNALTAEFDEPGRFLAIPGYEWSGNTSVGGDHNVWYRTEGRPIYRSHRALVMGESSDETTCIDAHQLFDRLKGEDALVVAHVGGRYADVSFAHDARLEPSVEVHSAWGTFDWIFEDAYSAGYRVGIVAASDGHKGRVGASYPGSGKFGSMGGLTCHLMEKLDRDCLFAAFRRRRHYATTGCRPYIDLRVANLTDATSTEPAGGSAAIDTAVIGDIVSCDDAEANLDMEIAAHAGIERVEILDGLTSLSVLRLGGEERQTGRRIRVQCEGAEYRGRGRLVTWDVTVTPEDAAIDKIGEVNFWNPDRKAQNDGSTVQWQNVTTGGTHAVDLWLDQAASGTLRIESEQTSFAVNLAGLGLEDHLEPCGGLGKAVRVTRLPAAELPRTLSHRLPVALEPGQERCLRIRVTFEDGHAAWTSPIYLSRKARA